LIEEIKHKTASEIDIIFRAMILLLTALPDPSDDHDCEIWQKDLSVKSAGMERELIKMFLITKDEQINIKELKDFADRVSKYISSQSQFCP
jgi:hypothetical protein